MPALYQGKYISSDDLIDDLTPQGYLAIFDDSNLGVITTVSATAVRKVIDRAEGLVDSYLIANNKLPLPTISNPTVDRLMFQVCLDFAHVLAWRRVGEYERRMGEVERNNSIWAIATETMKRIQAATQQLPDIVQQTGKKAANVGGIIVDSGPRTIIDSADGTSNDGDF